MKIKTMRNFSTRCWLFIAAMLFGQGAFAQIWTEDFEVDGEGVTYTSSASFNDGTNDHFQRTDGSTISIVGGAYSGQSGTFFWAGEDLDDAGSVDNDLLPTKTITFNPINVTGIANLEFAGLFATGNPGDGWDSTDELFVEYNMDGAGWTKVMQFASSAAGSNLGINHDSDLDGVGEGVALGTAFQEFTASIPGGGTSLEIRVTMTANSGSEEAAFDYFRVFDAAAGIPGCTNAAACNYNASATIEDGSCILPGDACDDNDITTTGDVILGDCSCGGTPIPFCTAPSFTPAEVTTNTSGTGGAWQPTANGFSVNAFCGGGCAEAVETWIVSVGYDFTGVVTSDLYFDSAESFGATTIEVSYTTAYNGDPSASTWTSLLTFDTDGQYSIDLSSLAGLTEVYLGFSYIDDGLDGYSSWTIENINLAGDCPTALFDCPLEMANIGDPCDDGNAATINDVIQGDCSCAGVIEGCTNALACNYDPAATVDNGSCLIIGAACDDGNPFSTGDVVDGTCTCNGTLPPQTNALLISAVYDGPLTGGFPKGIELYATADIPDLSIFGVGSANNGGGTDGVEFVFPADAVTAGTFIFVSNDATSAQTFFASAAVNYNAGTAMAINGDDAVELFENGLVIDTFGDINIDGTGTTWDYVDSWAARNCETGPDGGTFVEANWTFGPINIFDPVDPATGVNSDAAQPMPVAAYLETCPAVIFGCTDPGALNYDPTATDDDGSCVFSVPDIVINEIHYNPCTTQGVDPDYEFLELYNNSGAAVDISGWIISGAIDITFPGGTTMADGEYIIVTTVAALYTGNGYQVFECSGSLNNTAETATLSTDALIIVDQVGYSDSAPWPTAADGTCPSAELIDPALDNADGANWQASFVANGTPGAANSTAPPVIPYTIVECQTVATAGEFVNTAGIVTAVFPAQNLYTIQDGTGPNSGIWCEGTGVAIGDDVEVEGLLVEFFDETRISGASALVLSSGNALPATQVLATGSISVEQWEGVLVETTANVSTGDAGFGEWGVDDGSGEVLIDDYAVLVAPTTIGDTYTVIGPLAYTFSAFKIQPRDANDVLKWGCTDIAFPNYDPDAVIDDGSCALAIPGCLDPGALNYDPTATVDDGSCYYTLPDLVINELHYNPCTAQGDDLVYEFLEIYNNDVVSVDLEGYYFSLGVTYTFGAGATIAPGEYIIVCVDETVYTGNGYQVFQWTAGGLGNAGEEVELSDPFGNPVDYVFYDDASPWPAGAPDGGCSSLELIDPILDNNDGTNWQASWVANGTPGAVNSTPPPATPATIVEIQTVIPTTTLVVFSGVVTGVYPSSGLFTVQDGIGPYTGVWVSGAGVSEGDNVTIEGTVTEPFDLTTIQPTVITVNSSGNALPQAISLGTLPCNDEQWEGVLVTTTAPADQAVNGFGEFGLNDGTGQILADDLEYLATIELGATYSVTSPMYYSFGNYKFAPRYAADVEKWGCIDAGACNYDVDASIDSGCDYSCLGCTDAAADNYNAAATVDDGSCFIAGCIYADADNYNMDATIDDGSCTFTIGSTCPNDVNGDGVINTGDLTSLLGAFGTACP